MRPRLVRGRVLGGLVATALATLPSSGFAQAADHCAPSAAPVVGKVGIEARATMEHASYSTERYAGNYSGLHLGLSYAPPGSSRPLWDVAADVVGYRLVRNGQDELGLGDPFVRGRLRLWQLPAYDVALGLGLGVSVPLGDAAADLGMGHFMVHPAVWLGAGSKQLRTEWSLAYGRVLGDQEHAHVGPLVNPMNSSELAVGAALFWAPVSLVELRATAMGAAPVAAAGGEARATVSVGLGLVLGAVRVATGYAFPVAGDPFTEKLELTAISAF